jgi:hypothetical protein
VTLISDRWARRLSPVLTVATVAVVLGALFTFVLQPLLGRFTGEFEDFAAYAQAAHAVAAGTSPYAGFDPGTIVMSGFDYPPFAAVLLRPLALLSDGGQKLVWLWIALASLVSGAVIVARSLLPATWPRVRIAVLVALTFPPATYNLWHGQMNTVIFLLLALALSDYMSGHRTRCGVILGVAAGIKLAPIVLLLLLARRGWWRGAAAGVVTAAATVVIGIAALGWPITHHYLGSVLPVLGRDNGWIYNQTWNGVINRLAAHSVLASDGTSIVLHGVITLASVATVVGVLWVVGRPGRTHAERGAEFAAVVIAMVLVGTIAWYPVYVHLLIALAAGVGLAHERGMADAALLRWTAAALVGVGGVAALAIAALSMPVIAEISRGPLWWVFLQACSLPAALSGGLLWGLLRALHSRRPVPLSRSAALAR